MQLQLMESHQLLVDITPVSNQYHGNDKVTPAKLVYDPVVAGSYSVHVLTAFDLLTPYGAWLDPKAVNALFDSLAICWGQGLDLFPSPRSENNRVGHDA